MPVYNLVTSQRIINGIPVQGSRLRYSLNPSGEIERLKIYIKEQGSGLTKEQYLEMCEMLNTVPDPTEMPVEREEPAPVVVQEPAPAPAPEPVPEPEPIVVELPEDFIIYFDFDSAELDWKAKEVVMAVVAAFNEHGNAALMLAGHTDTRGTQEYNDKLAKKRAWAVKAALMEAGIAESALSMETHGEHDLAVKTEDGVKNAENRRVEVSFSLAM